MKMNVAYYSRIMAVIGYVILIPFNFFMGYMAYAFSDKTRDLILTALSIIICLFAIRILFDRILGYRSGIASKNYEVIAEAIIMIITASVPMLMILAYILSRFELDTFLYLCLLLILPTIILIDNIPHIKGIFKSKRAE